MKPTVSVKTITYNHVNFIRQCIEGVLMQKTTFKIEYIISDDCSTDGTREIVEEYAKKYPDIIKDISPNQNLGAIKNGIRVRNACSGKYQAGIEGDDYWIDPLKLQKQVDFLEANPDYVISYTDYSQTIEGSKQFIEKTNLFHKETLEISDLLENNYITTLTCVFRSNLFSDYPEHFSKLKVGDWPLHMLNAKYGKIKYHKGWNTAVYRMHQGGIWSTQNKTTKYLAYAEVYEFFKSILEYKYHKKIKEKIIDYYYSAASVYLEEKNKKEASEIIKKIAKESSVFNIKYLKIKLKSIIN